MIDAHDSPLEQAPEAFNALNARPVTACILAGRMTHRSMAVAPSLQPDVAVVLIGMNVAAALHIVSDLAEERESLHVGHPLDTNLATTLQHSEQDRLVLSAKFL